VRKLDFINRNFRGITLKDSEVKKIDYALIRELNSKILDQKGKIQNAKLKIIDLNKQLTKIKGE